MPCGTHAVLLSSVVSLSQQKPTGFAPARLVNAEYVLAWHSGSRFRFAWLITQSMVRAVMLRPMFISPPLSSGAV